MHGVSHVAGREDVRVGGPQRGVDDDAVARLQARRLGQLGVRRDPDADDDRLGVDLAAVGQADAGDPAARAGDLAHLHAEPGAYDDVIVRGDLSGREFIAFWLADGRVLAGMNVNIWDVNDKISALVRVGLPVDPARLADPDVPLEALAV